MKASCETWAVGEPPSERRRNSCTRSPRETCCAREPAPASLGQILDILLSNTTNHGHGTAEARRRGDRWVRMEGQDDGDGIMTLPEPSLSATEPGQDGHGLGLPLARLLAEGAGGALIRRRVGRNNAVAVLVSWTPVQGAADSVLVLGRDLGRHCYHLST
jgi:hypothetical protein